eukprot:gene10572-3091_t
MILKGFNFFLFCFVFLIVNIKCDILLRPSHKYDQERCYVSKNNFLKFYPLDISNSAAQITGFGNTTHFGFEASFCGKEGYSSITYSRSSNLNDTYAKYIFFDQYIMNATDMTVKPFEQDSFTRGNWKLRQFYYKKDHRYFKNLLNSTLIFECNRSQKPWFNITSSTWMIPPPDETTVVHGSHSVNCQPYVCDNNLNIISLPYFVVSQISFFILIILSIIARNWQPFKSRGFILIWGLILQFIANFGYSLSYYATVQQGYHYELLQFTLLCFPLALLIRFLVLTNYLKMLIILGIKNNYNYLNSTRNSFSIKLLKFFKFLTTDLSIFVQSILFYIIFVLILFPIYFFTSSDITILGATRASAEIINTISIITEIVFYCSLSLLIIIDYILNSKIFFCNPKKFWIDSDPFLYRIQQLILIPIAILFIVYEIFISPDFWKVDACCLSNRYFTLRVIVKSLILYFIIFYFSGFLLLVTYYKKIKKLLKTNKKSNEFQNLILDDTIDSIFKNPTKLKMFKSFAEKEFSLENIFLYEQIKIFEELENEQRREKANLLFSKFLNGANSELEVNVAGNQTKDIMKHLNDESYFIDKEFFSDILHSIKENLSDTYSRFQLTEEYEHFRSINYLVSESTGFIMVDNHEE